ncbi:universal stress protein [Zafaria sp. Z1313]|uniref:universal stress protein n=1 Tax=unclassified Zafaria TaxID=2828765 RepID=UPI002E767C68|nr:universal stress protein [Zafaria sp. J156]MEE1621920.1 universal stress protein [Zafaria sp. J156]
MAAILVAFDGSDSGNAAFRWAVDEAALRGWGLCLVAVAEPVPVTNARVDAQYQRRMSEQAGARLAEAAARAEGRGVPTEVHVLSGHVADALRDLSRTFHLAAVGRTGASGLGQRVFGSLSQALSTHAHCSTVVVPADWAGPGPGAGGRVVAAVRASGDGHVAEAAAEAASARARPLLLLTAERRPAAQSGEDDGGAAPSGAAPAQGAGSDGPSLARALRERYPGLELSVESAAGPAARAVAGAVGAGDLLVVGSRGHVGLAGLVLGSVSQPLVRDAPCPVMVVSGALRIS